MSRTYRILAIAGLAALVSAAGLAQTPQGPVGPQRRPGAPGLGLPPGVNLTEAQRDQIRAMRQDEQVAVRDQLKQLRDARRALHEEIFADTPNSSKIDDLQQQITATSQQLEARRLELQQRIAQVLTPEQRKFVREHRGQIRAFRAGRMMERRLMQERRRPRGVI